MFRSIPTDIPREIFLAFLASNSSRSRRFVQELIPKKITSGIHEELKKNI